MSVTVDPGAEELDHVPGQHHRERPGLGGQVTRQHLTGTPGNVGPFRRQVQVTDRDHFAAGRDVHLEQVGEVRSRGGHGGAFLFFLGSPAPGPVGSFVPRSFPGT